MELKKTTGLPVGEFHRCDAPLAGDETLSAEINQAEATGTCEPTVSDPNQWNLWAERISAGPLHIRKPD